MTNKSFFKDTEKTKEAKDTQIGGDHYKLKHQPFDFCMDNNLNFFFCYVIKYVVCYQKKNGIEDLNKIIHYCQLEIDRIRKNWDE